VQIRSASELCIPVKVHSFVSVRHWHTSCAKLSTLHSHVLEGVLRMLFMCISRPRATVQRRFAGRQRRLLTTLTKEVRHWAAKLAIQTYNGPGHRHTPPLAPPARALAPPLTVGLPEAETMHFENIGWPNWPFFCDVGQTDFI